MCLLFASCMGEKASTKSIEDRYFTVLNEEQTVIGERTPLHKAAEEGDLEAIEKLFDQGVVDVNAEDNEGRTPLHFAAVGGKLEVVEALIAKGANVHAQDNMGNTPLHNTLCLEWIDEKDLEILEFLAKKLENKKLSDINGFTPYTIAYYKSDLQMRKDLLALLDDEGYTKSFMIKKFLVFRFTLEDKKLHSGLMIGMGLFELICSFESFLKKNNTLTGFSKDMGNNVLEILKKSYRILDMSVVELYDKYLEEEPFFSLTRQDDHTCAVLFSEKEHLEMRGNRGDRDNDEKPGIKIFNDKILDLIDFDDFSNILNGARLEDINKEMGSDHLYLPDQIGGVCTWVGSTMGLLMVLYYELISQSVSPREAKEMAHKAYREFTHGEGGDLDNAVKEAIVYFRENGDDFEGYTLLSKIYFVRPYMLSSEVLEELGQYIANPSSNH